MNKPWLNEPDKVEFRYKGFPCLIVRNQSGALCGYAGVPPTHPLHGYTCHESFPESNYNEKVMELSVHGGVTFSGSCQADGPICHKPAPGEPDNVWWIGFDCSHYGDFMPYMDDPESEHRKLMKQAEEALKDAIPEFKGLPNFSECSWKKHSTYKTIAFVKNEIRSLVKQLEKAA